MAKVDFSVDPTLAPFFQAKEFYQFVTGPIGSTKTTTCIMKIMMLAAQQAPMPDGIRRTRWALIRTTLPELKRSVLKDIQYWLGPVATWHPSENLIKVRAGDVEADLLLMSFDRPENQRRLLSLQLTGCYLNEFREIDFELLGDIAGRCGRYPAHGIVPCSWAGIIADSNPSSKASKWYDFLVRNPDTTKLHYTAQPSGLSAEATWRQYLRPDYYENLAAGRSGRWVDQHIHGKWVDSADGKAVYQESFNHDFHIAKEPLRPVRAGTLLVGMDFARHPAAVIGQVDPRGRLLVLAEVEHENMGLETFIHQCLRPVLAQERFLGLPVAVVGDPSGNQRSQIGEESVFQALRRLGFVAVSASTNAIEPRIRAVEKWLLQHDGGRPRLVVDPACRVLIDGFMERYIYKAKKDGSLEEVPAKVRPWADVHDALQYLCLGTAQNVLPRIMTQFSPMKRDPVPTGAWT